MHRRFVNPKDHRGLQVETPYSMGVHCDDLFFLSGRVDISGDGTVQRAGDLLGQTKVCVAHIESILGELGADLEDLVQLVVFYVNDGTVDEDGYRDTLGGYLSTKNKPTVQFVPIPYLHSPGLEVEIDAYAMRRQNGHRITRECITASNSCPVGEAFSHGLRCGEMIFGSGLAPRDAVGAVLYKHDVVQQSHLVLGYIDNLLTDLGAQKQDLVKINNWYVGAGTAEHWTESARVRAEFYPEPGPVATGIPAHFLWPRGVSIQTGFWAMLGENGEHLSKRHAWPEGHWDWPIHLPFKHGLKCQNMIFVGGQVSMSPDGSVVDANDIETQTHTSMNNIGRVLAELGANHNDIVKMNTFYQRGNYVDHLHRNGSIPNGYFSKPGPTSTSISVKHLAYEGMMIEIETISMVTDD